MKNLSLLSIVFLLLFPCCSDKIEAEDQLVDKDNRLVTFTCKIEETESRMALVQDNLDIKLYWEEGDQIDVCLIYGENVQKQAAELVNISLDGKMGEFSLLLPEGDYTTFDMYGVYGGEGIDKDNPTKVNLPLHVTSGSLDSIQKAKIVMLTFEKQNINRTSPKTTINFNHLGSLFSIKLKNTGTSDIEKIKGVVLSSDEPIGVHSNREKARYDLVTGEFSGTTTTNNLSFEVTEATGLSAGDTLQFWGWFPLVKEKTWPELKLKVLNQDNNVIGTSSNNKPERTEPTSPGKAYYFYAAWNNSGILFTGSDFEAGIVEAAFMPVVRPGKNRLEISWAIPVHPNLYEYTVSWNDGMGFISGLLNYDKTGLVTDDSLSNMPGDFYENKVIPENVELQLPGIKPENYDADGVIIDENSRLTDTISLLLDNMPESSYDFKITLFDKQGNQSDATLVSGFTYGENLEQTITNRYLRSAVKERDYLITEWSEPLANSISVEIAYTDLFNEHQAYFIGNSTRRDTLKNIGETVQFQYRTLYLPTPTALDTLYTGFNEMEVKEIIVPEDGLVAHYPFDNSGEDKSVHKNHAAHLSATPSLNRYNEPGKALFFDGDKDYVEIANRDYLSIPETGVLTISIWIRPDVYDFKKWQASDPFVHWMGKGEGGKHEYAGRIYNKSSTNPNRITFYAFNLIGGLGDGTYVKGPIKTGEWIHLVVIHDYLRDTIDLFKNGRYIQSGHFNQFGVTPQKGSAPLRVGTRDFGSFFEGGMDDLRIYNRVLAPDEIKALYLE